MPIHLRTKTRIYTDTHMNTTPLLALYYHPKDPIAGTVLLPTQTMIVLICMWSIKQPIMPIRLRSTDRMTVLMYLQSTDRPIDELYIQPLLLPDARTIVFFRCPHYDNYNSTRGIKTCQHALICLRAIPITVILISLRPKHN